MNIRNRRELTSFAAQQIASAPQEKRIILIYTGLVLGTNLLSVLLNYVLGLQIDQHTGLRGLSTRNTLSTIQTMLPLLHSALVMCLDLGYLSAMLRIARGQYASPNGLRLGFDRFWVLLRSQLILIAFYIGIAFISIYASCIIYMITPFSEDTTAILAPLVSGSSVLNPEILLDEATYSQLLSTMTPFFVIFVIVFLALYIPVTYRFRMVRYVIIDKPGIGAIAALRESRMMMRRNAVNLFKLDLHLWWYYAALLIASIICYGDQILPLLGIEFPFSYEFAYFLFYAVYLAAQAVIYYFLRNSVEVTYALAYESLKPEEKKDNGVVLGNIFQM